MWSARSLADLVDKIEQTMPPGQPGSVARPQAIDLAAFILRSGKFPAGQADLGAAELGQIAFPARTLQRRATAWHGVVIRCRCATSRS